MGKDGAPCSSFTPASSLVRKALPAPEAQPGEDGQEEAKGKGKGKKGSRSKKKGKGDANRGDEDQDEPAVPKFSKKVTNKITVLSTKLTEVRCFQTQLKASGMYHTWSLDKNFSQGPEYFNSGGMSQQTHFNICACQNVLRKD